MEFAILGPLRVDGPGGSITIGAPKQRALLAALLLAHREDGVSTARLIDVIWDADPPATAGKALQVQVSQLRRALGADAIVTRPNGYAIGAGSVDLATFERLVAEARDAPPAEAARLLRDALALFRGPPLADAPLYGPAHGEADRLAELRLSALERRIAADLALGRHAELASELDPLTHEHPYRERFHAQRMLALYRAGRQADALEAYRRARAVLIEDLGIEPGRELQRLHEAILAQDPALDLHAPPPRRARPRSRCPPPRCSAATPTSRPPPRCWRRRGCSRSPGRAGSARPASRSSSPTGSAGASARARASSRSARWRPPPRSGPSSSRRLTASSPAARSCSWSTTSSSCSTPRRSWPASSTPRRRASSS
jgi:DNA-binding SARP family transcriptional activator